VRNIFLFGLFGVKLLSILAFSGTVALAQALPPGTRGLEISNIDEFSRLAQSDQLNARQKSLMAGKLWEDLLKLREGIQGSATADQRRQLVLLQTQIEELVMGIPGAGVKVFGGDTFLTPDEVRGAGQMRGVLVVPGDVIIQIGASYMSSHFIAHSQSNPGLASHSYVVSKGGVKPEILEALIEDGVNRRDPTKSQLARFWVLALNDANDRAKAGKATADFITKENIPFVPNGRNGTASPLLYDSTMNPERKKDGYYFCTALTQEIYQRAGVGDAKVPYLADQSNWNSLTGLEKGVYEQLDITAGKVPAPNDVLYQPQFKVRGMVLDADGLRKSRRLRAVVDAFFDILASQPEVKGQLLAAFQQIPKLEVKKQEVLAALAKIQVTGYDQTTIDQLRAKLEESLPQTANLRQIAFFLILNGVIQDKALATLEKFEKEDLKRHAAPGELRAAAIQFLGGEFAKINELMKHISN